MASLAEAAELLRESYWSRDGSWGKVLGVLGSLSEGFRAAPQAQELLELALRAQQATLQRLGQ